MNGAAALAAGFSAALRAGGVHAGTRRARSFAEALACLPPDGVAELYWLARVSLLPSIADLPAFELAFGAFFGAGTVPDPPGGPAATPGDRPPPRVQRAAAPPPAAETADERAARDAPTRWLVASLEETLRERSFDTIAQHERAALLRLIAQVRTAGEPRPSRRVRAAARGERFDFRRTLRVAPRTLGELIRRRRSRRRERLRPLVFLVDVSGSMAPFARALLLYARATVRARDAVRAFAFATRLTDVTPLLRRTSDEELFLRTGALMRDFGGGTRIGAAIAAFVREYAQRGIARGGTVVILSDGWERDDPAALAEAMARLRRLTRRIVWINPQKRHPAYEPLVRGMAAALPSVDVLLSGHNVLTLEAVAAAIEGAFRSARNSGAAATRR